MLTAPETGLDTLLTATETPHLELLPAWSDPRQPAEAGQGAQSSAAGFGAGLGAGVRAVEVATPAEPTARFHWVGALGLFAIRQTSMPTCWPALRT